MMHMHRESERRHRNRETERRKHRNGETEWRRHKNRETEWRRHKNREMLWLRIGCYGINLNGKTIELYSMAFVPCHMALVPLKKKKRWRPNGLAPKIT
jgi:FMN phosphatase YigB (HAD superfamily)